MPPIPPAPQPNPTSEVSDSTHPDHGIDEDEKNVLQPESEINYLNGSQDNNVIDGTQGRDIINGGIYNNVLSGLGGNDTLMGNKGFDRLNGGAGDDMLDGGEGISVLNGGAGSDTFVLYDADMTWVQDFNPESDRLELAGDLTYQSLDFDGEVNSFISYEGNRIATLLDVNQSRTSPCSV